MSGKFVDIIKLRKGTVYANVTLIGYREDGAEDGMFIFYSPALDLYGYGDDEKEAIKSFEETIHLHIQYVLEENTLEKDLKRLGWTKHKFFKKRFDPPKYDPREIMSKRGVGSFMVNDQKLELQAC